MSADYRIQDTSLLKMKSSEKISYDLVRLYQLAVQPGWNWRADFI